ncbi:MAG: TrkA family potassium uptake protein [Actinomycetes bacterium]|nr:MAG: potassium transporter TrkA [Actinomycetota bacterium]
MHVVIMGCGRTGATLAAEFESRGHSVAVIDMRADAFRRLPSDFQGQKITGVGFDRDTLAAAGVEEAYGFAAVSDGDNSNILAARVVRETYGVENVVARIADSGRAEVYRRLGIPTVAPVPWTAAEIMGRLLPGSSEDLYTDRDSGVTLRRLRVNEAWIGRPYAELEAAAAARVAYVTRFGASLLPTPDTLVQDGDDVFVVLLAGTERKAEKVFARPPGTAS